MDPSFDFERPLGRASSWLRSEYVRFVFSILHPCYHTAFSGELRLPDGTVRTVGRYFDEGYWRSDSQPGPPGKVGAYHRTLSTYLNTLADAGLTLERSIEPNARENLPASPSLAHMSRPVWSEVPAVLTVRCRNGTRDARG